MKKADKNNAGEAFLSFEDVLDPDSIAEKDWVNTPSMWPAMEFGHVYTYLVDLQGIFTEESMKA